MITNIFQKLAGDVAGARSPAVIIASGAGRAGLRDTLGTTLREPDGVPGVVSSVQTFGTLANWHSHLRLLVTDGLFRLRDRDMKNDVPRREASRSEESA